MAQKKIEQNLPLGFLNTATPPEAQSMEGQATEMKNFVRLPDRLAKRGGFADSGFLVSAAAITTSQVWCRYVHSAGSVTTEFNVCKLSGGTIVAALAASTTLVARASGLGTTRGAFFQRDNYLYYTGAGGNKCLRYTGSGWRVTGVGAEAGSPVTGTVEQASGGIEPGDVCYCVSPHDRGRRVWGQRSLTQGSYAALDADNGGAVVTWGSATQTVGGSKASHVLIWRAKCVRLPNGVLAFGRKMQLVTSATNGGVFGDTLPEGALGDEYMGRGGKPPAADISIFYNDRAYYLAGGTLWYSDRGRPEMVASSDERNAIKFREPRPYGENRIHVPGIGTGLAEYDGRLFVFTTTDSFVLLGDGHTARLAPTAWGAGCAFHQSIAKCKYGLFWLSAQGVCRLSGDGFTVLTTDLIDFDGSGVVTRSDRTGWDGAYPAIGVYDPVRELYILALKLYGATDSFLLVYDCRRRGFYRWVLTMAGTNPVTSLAVLRDQSAEPSLIVGTSGGAFRYTATGKLDNANAFPGDGKWWFGQGDISQDKIWSNPRLMFRSGDSGSPVVTLSANNVGTVTDAQAGSVVLNGDAVGPHTPLLGGFTGPLCQLRISHAASETLSVTQLRIDRRPAGPQSLGIGKA